MTVESPEYWFYTCIWSRESTTKGSLQKKKCVFFDIGPKGGWVPVSKHNFFWRRNCDIYQRWVGVKHRCHNFIYSYPFLFFAYFHFHGKKGSMKMKLFCWTPPLDFMEIELDNTEDKLCFKTLLNIMLKFLLVILRDKLLLKMRFHIQLFNQWEHWETWSWPTTCFMKLALYLSLLRMCSYLVTVSTSANKLAGALALTTNM